MALLFVTLWKYELASKHATFRLRALKRRLAAGDELGPQPAPVRGAHALMPALPLDEAGKYVAAAYLVFLALILIYVAIMAGRLSRIERDLGEVLDTLERREVSGRGAGRAVNELFVVGASHKTAGLAVRERLALLDGQIEGFLQSLDVTEAVAVSTCNRTELYVVAESADVALAALETRAGGGVELYVERNCDAARHLHRVVCGLDSMIVGEAEIQGQVKRAYERALAARTTGPMTNRLFRSALATGKRVRTETAVGVGHASVATVAVDAARSLVGELASRHVVIVGAGENSEAVARAFHAHGVTTMFVANRRRDRAIALALAVRRVLGVVRRAAGGAGAGGRGGLLDRLAARDHRGARAGGRDGVARRAAAAAGRSRGAAGHRSGVRVAGRRDPARHGRAAGVGALAHERAPGRGRAGRGDRRGGDPGVRGLARAARRAADADRAALAGRRVVAGLLDENAGRWESLSERDLERVEALARAVVNRLLHEPTRRVRELGSEHRHARLALLRELFGLEDAEPAAAEDDAEIRRLFG